MNKGVQLGLYAPETERDSCGIGCVANINGAKSHDVISDAITMLERMEHRGGTGSDPDTGDGAGILIQISHSFFKGVTEELGIALPAQGTYGIGMIFFPRDKKVREECRSKFNEYIDDQGFELLGYREVPVDNKVPGKGATAVEPVIEQVFLKRKFDALIGDDFERKLFV
ncbi:MAG: glutamate synthase subunit alpha, partial [Cyclobacteriaceae bacterium]|nr:glutamate synthase subunit alpha [Cyclobacteriaceae bacterium]